MCRIRLSWNRIWLSNSTQRTDLSVFADPNERPPFWGGLLRLKVDGGWLIGAEPAAFSWREHFIERPGFKIYQVGFQA